MPRKQGALQTALGSENPYGALCPECGSPLVLENKRASGMHEYICPRLKLEFGQPGDVHAVRWHWQIGDLKRLAAGLETSWHQREVYRPRIRS